MSKRMIGVEGTPPHLVVCVPSALLVISPTLLSITLPHSPNPSQPHSVTPLPSLLYLQVVIPLSAAVDCQAIHSLLCGVCEKELVPIFSPLTTLSIPSLKQRFTFAFPPASNLCAVLDVAKVCLHTHWQVMKISIYTHSISVHHVVLTTFIPPFPLAPFTSSRSQTLYYWFTMLGRGWTP